MRCRPQANDGPVLTSATSVHSEPLGDSGPVLAAEPRHQRKLPSLIMVLQVSVKTPPKTARSSWMSALVPKLCFGTHFPDALLPGKAKQSFAEAGSQAELGNQKGTIPKRTFLGDPGSFMASGIRPELGIHPITMGWATG